MAMDGFTLSYAWLIAGLALLVGELLLPGVYLLFPGIGALVIGINALWLPAFSWQSQWIGFALVTGVATLLGHRLYGRRAKPAGDVPLNERTARLVGRRAVVSEEIRNGRGRVAVDDGWWSAEGPDLAAGAPVVIEAAEGSILRVRPAEPRPPV